METLDWLTVHEAPALATPPMVRLGMEPMMLAWRLLLPDWPKALTDSMNSAETNGAHVCTRIEILLLTYVNLEGRTWGETGMGALQNRIWRFIHLLQREFTRM